MTRPVSPPLTSRARPHLDPWRPGRSGLTVGAGRQFALYRLLLGRCLSERGAAESAERLASGADWWKQYVQGRVIAGSSVHDRGVYKPPEQLNCLQTSFDLFVLKLCKSMPFEGEKILQASSIQKSGHVLHLLPVECSVLCS